jgi:hypothetical protein
MRSVLARSWKNIATVALLIGVDLAVSLPIMGATYRPFSWMSIAPADAVTLYPVIQNMSFDVGRQRVFVEVNPGSLCVLQRTTDPTGSGGWTDVATTTATEQVIFLIDTNPVSRAVFYRVKEMLGENP